MVAWPDEFLGVTSEVRDEYLAAIKTADTGDYDRLAALHRRFADSD